MLIRTVVAILIMILFGMAGNNLKQGEMRKAVSDQELINMLCIMDNALIQYYTSHGGELPDNLNEETLNMMKLGDYNWEKFTYVKDGKKYNLSVDMNDGTTKYSGISGKTLNDVQIQND